MYSILFVLTMNIETKQLYSNRKKLNGPLTGEPNVTMLRKNSLIWYEEETLRGIRLKKKSVFINT